MIQQEAQTSNNVVIGMLVVEILLAWALFDLRATHSFISTHLASRIKKSKKALTKTLLVSTPLGKLLPVSEEINRCEIKVG